MNTVLALEVAVSIETCNHNGCALNTCSVTVEPVGQFYVKSTLFCPTGDHTVEHLRPVLRLSTTCTGVEGYNGVALVVLARKENLDTASLFLGNNGIELTLHFFYVAFVVFFNRHFCQSDRVFKTRAKFFVAGNLILTLLNVSELFQKSGACVCASRSKSNSLVSSIRKAEPSSSMLSLIPSNLYLASSNATINSYLQSPKGRMSKNSILMLLYHKSKGVFKRFLHFLRNFQDKISNDKN